MLNYLNTGFCKFTLVFKKPCKIFAITSKFNTEIQMFTVLCHKKNLHSVNLLVINKTLDGGDKNSDSD